MCIYIYIYIFPHPPGVQFISGRHRPPSPLSPPPSSSSFLLPPPSFLLLLPPYYFAPPPSSSFLIPPLPMHGSYPIPIQIWWTMISEASLRFQGMLLILFLSKTGEHPLWHIYPLPMHVSYSILIRNLMKHLSEASVLFQCMFLIQFLFTLDEHPSLKHPSASNACFLFNFYLKTGERPLWNTPPLPMHVSYSVLTQSCYLFNEGHPNSPSPSNND